jgi:hypothetical protein
VLSKAIGPLLWLLNKAVGRHTRFGDAALPPSCLGFIWWLLAIGAWLTAITLEPQANSLIAAESESPEARRPASDVELKRWLQNMVWFHRFSIDEIQQATGLSGDEIAEALQRLDISAANRPARKSGDLLQVVPYPGGRHPRIGFLDGAVRPQRDTKVSVFTPWDDSSYVVLDVPEAIWSNLGLTYLAHTHVPTIWSKQDVRLPPVEWQIQEDGSMISQRTLPNGIKFGTKVVSHRDHVQLEMWLTNGSPARLTDLRVQNCVLLKGAKGFTEQTNNNKVIIGPYVACRSNDGKRWIISAWDPLHRAWANPPCPCLHSDPKFPDCNPGETQRLRGWLSFFEGDDIQAEFARIDATGWKSRPFTAQLGTPVSGRITDADTGQLIPARLQIRDQNGGWHFADSQSPAGSAVHYRKNPQDRPASVEMHTTLSADPFVLRLPPGNYTIRCERGKEYIPLVQQVSVGDEPVRLELQLRRWIHMAERNWFSGETHVHRPVNELPNVVLAEDLNVALPITYWVRDAGAMPTVPATGDSTTGNEVIRVDDTHVIYPMNTEYELFTVNGRAHTLGAVFVLNHKQPLQIAAPPVKAIAEEARRQGAILDLDKHSWPWSLMLIPIMKVDLFELTNNHLWQTEFGFTQWTLSAVPEYMKLEMSPKGFTEWGWADFGFQTYYALLNCGFRLRVTGGTASGVHPVQLGFGRVYVHLPDGFSYEAWMQGLNEGRSFVTTGPMLELNFNGQDPGHRFEFDSKNTAHEIALSGFARSLNPLDRIEIIINGQIARTVTPQNRPMATGGYETEIQSGVQIDSSSWIAVRCFERHPQKRLRFAHTNPVFIDIPGRPLTPRKEEVQYLIRRMNEEIARNRDVLDAQSLQEYEQARAVYDRLIPK